MPILKTQEACSFFNRVLIDIKDSIVLLNSRSFDASAIKVNLIANKIKIKKTKIQREEDVLNDFFVISRFVRFVSSYISLWEKILNAEFCSSWNYLQDCFSLLRIIKKFSSINIDFFENQLLNLEKLYPYNVFLSVGATVEKLECSLCGLDIDSAECPHIRGELYGGKMAQAIATNLVELNHVSFVTTPVDKRCVVKYEDSAEQFKLVRYLAELINKGRLNILDFSELKFSKKLTRNPNYQRIGRNKPCYCGSGKKFKKCCISKEHIEGDHVDIIKVPKTINDVIT